MFKIFLLCSLFLSGFSVHSTRFLMSPEDILDILRNETTPLQKNSAGNYILALSNRGLTQLNLKDHVREVPEDLHSLNLLNNHLSSLPDEIATFRNLEDLTLKRNKFTEVPSVIWRLKSLKSLDLNENQITTLSDNIAELENLKYLYLTGNPLTKLPQALSGMPSLEVLEIPEALQYDPILPLIPNLDHLVLQYGPGVLNQKVLFGQDLQNHLASITGRKTKRAE